MKKARSKPRRRRVRGRQVVMAGIALAALVAAASARQTRTSQPSQAAAAPHAVPMQRAFIDPQTGALREPTAEEVKEMAQEMAAASAMPAEPEPITSAEGFPGLKLSDDFSTYTVASKNADGTVSIRHATGPKEAERLVRAKEAHSDR